MITGPAKNLRRRQSSRTPASLLPATSQPGDDTTDDATTPNFDSLLRDAQQWIGIATTPGRRIIAAQWAALLEK